MSLYTGQLIVLFVLLGGIWLLFLLFVLWLRKAYEKEKRVGRNLESDIAMWFELWLTTPEGIKRFQENLRKYPLIVRIMFPTVILILLLVVIWLRYFYFI